MKPRGKKETGRLAACLLLECSLIASGCGSSSAVTGVKGDYQAAKPWQTSDTRGKHVGLLSDIDIRIELEKGLMDLSKNYFPPSDVQFRSHVFLDYDELDATDGSRGLLGTLRDDNPNGLNPGSDETFDTGNGMVTGPILVADLYELDFYNGEALSGISIGLAVADAVTINGQRTLIAPEQMKGFLQVTAAKINSYLKERFNEISSNVPVLVAAYQLNTDPESSAKGGYIYSEFFQGSQSEYHQIDQQYLVVPSSAFSERSADCAEQFSQYKASLAAILPDTTYVTGQARYQNGTLDLLTIEVSAYGKTAGEILAVTQSAKDSLAVFADPQMACKVIIRNNGEICTLMERAAGSTECEMLSIY